MRAYHAYARRAIPDSQDDSQDGYPRLTLLKIPRAAHMPIYQRFLPFAAVLLPFTPRFLHK